MVTRLLIVLILVSISFIVMLTVNRDGTATKTTDQFKISIPQQSHTDYGLAYPVTYMFDVPTGGINVLHKHSPDADWEALAAKTEGDYFNGIEAVRFDGPKAYVSVAFDAGSDDIYLSFTDGSGDPAEGVTYTGISEYYDNRKAVVTMTNDDYGSFANLASFQEMWEATSFRNIWSTSAVITTRAIENHQWDELQAAIDSGCVEVASHTQTHQYAPYNDELEASKQDITGNLVLPQLYRSDVSEYVTLFIAPYLSLTSDDLTQCSTSRYLAMISYEMGTEEPGWGTWNDTEGIYNPKYVSSSYESMTEEELNARFNERYSEGDIYHLRGHPYNESTWASGKMADHLDYIKGKSDIWYVGYGAMYMYHYVQERDLITVSDSNIDSPRSSMVIGITPDSGTTEDSALFVTITGTGFESGSGLALELNNNGTDSISATGLNWVNPTQINATFDLTGVSTNLGETWDIKVTNPDGQAGTGNDLFTIYRPDPIITSITPSIGVNNGTVHVTLTGINFVTEQTSVKLTKKGERDITGTSIVINDTTEITADFDLTGQAAGNWNIVALVNGAQSQAIFANGFTITQPEAPTVTNITPDSGTTEGSALFVTITGTGFESGSGLALELNNNGADSISATDLNWVNSTQINATFDLTGVSTNLGETWDIKVTNPDGQAGTGNDLFTIYRPDPIITSITPSIGVNNGTVHVTLSGSNFVTEQTSVKLTRKGEGDITGTDIVINDTTEITADFDLTGQAAGNWNIVALVNGAQSQAIFANGFTITQPEAPTVTNITPDSGTTEGSALFVTITGTGFESGSGLALELNNNGADSISATDLNWVNSTQINATFDLTGVSTNLGETWDIKVTNPDGQTGTGNDLFTIYRPDPIIVSITPDSGIYKGTVHVTITGSNFVTEQTSVKLTRKGEDDITGTDIVINGTTEITADFDLTGQARGEWNVVVFVEGAQSSDTLDDGFTILRRFIFFDD